MEYIGISFAGCKVFYPLLRFGHHQVAVEKGIRQVFSHALNYGGPEC